MYMIDFSILNFNSQNDEFNKDLQLLAKDLKFKDVKYDKDGDVEYLVLQNGYILIYNGFHPKIVDPTDYFYDGDALLIRDEVKALIKVDEPSFIYTKYQKLEILFVGKQSYFVRDEDGEEFSIRKDSSSIIDKEITPNKIEFEIDMGQIKKEDFLRALEIIKKGVLA